MRQADHERRRLLATSLAAVTTASGSSSWCALIGLRCPSSFIDTGSARAEWLRAPYRRHDVVDCLAGCGGVGFVVEKRLVDSVAICSCADLCFASFPVSAVRTISGLPLRLVRADACCIDVFATPYSSTKLARWLAVEELARASSRERGGRVV